MLLNCSITTSMGLPGRHCAGNVNLGLPRSIPSVRRRQPGQQEKHTFSRGRCQLGGAIVYSLFMVCRPGAPLPHHRGGDSLEQDGQLGPAGGAQGVQLSPAALDQTGAHSVFHSLLGPAVDGGGI